MKTFRIEKNVERYRSEILDSYLGGMRVAYFDIETTGLSPDRSRCILIGLGCFAEDMEGRTSDLSARGSESFVTVQYFAERTSDEAELLKAFWKAAESFDVMVSYNGNRFDWPFVVKRSQALGLKCPRGAGSYLYRDSRSGGSRHGKQREAAVSYPRARQAGISTEGPAGLFTESPMPYDLDLYRVVRYHSPLKSMLPNLRQKTVEDFLGLWTERKDQIDGRQSIDLYYEYLHCSDVKEKQGLEAVICLHNSDDVAQLAGIMKVLSRCDFHAAMSHYGFPIRYVGKPSYAENSLSVAKPEAADAGYRDCCGYRPDEGNYRERADTVDREVCATVSSVKLARGIFEIKGFCSLQDGEYYDAPALGCHFSIRKGDFTFTMKTEEGFDARFIDAQKLLSGQMLESGFAVLERDGQPDYRMMNVCARAILTRLLFGH